MKYAFNIVRNFCVMWMLRLLSMRIKKVMNRDSVQRKNEN